jgi:hypothetical protein
MRLMLNLHVLTVAVTASYLTLIAFAQDDATDLLVPYAVVVFVLAVVNLATERRIRDARRAAI